MSTIASPRDPSGPFPRRTNSSIITPTSSSRPSLDVPASASGSPNPNITSTSTNAQSKRANRTALREYYNIRASSSPTTTTNNNNNKPLPSPPTVSITDPSSSSSSSVPIQPSSELDSPDFDAQSYIARLLSTASLADLLRTYTRVLSEMRALDAEKKALVYDNYSKLIAATETIRRMRATTTEGEGGDGGLEGVVEGIYKMAVELREGLRVVVKPPFTGEVVECGDDVKRKRERTRELAREVVKVPGRVRRLMEEGREEEARREWEVPRRLLVRWKELGVGGDEVGALIEKGDAALRAGQEGHKSEMASSTT
ncbi:hypothetical protein N657DRAFT_572281 [Parathielavia appendiculata]|uniref:Vacuolar protein sorting-associated protein 51 homolog n=1 Tax=Parathielavia appendiculata TaxID=2587402 RepID=A0AAN6Z482_9PEZI|nr:hypothetical protein N657DRAFT_572281 [Parathielavia appendiculata]